MGINWISRRGIRPHFYFGWQFMAAASFFAVPFALIAMAIMLEFLVAILGLFLAFIIIRAIVRAIRRNARIYSAPQSRGNGYASPVEMRYGRK